MRSLTRIGLAFLFFAQLSSIGFAQSRIIITVADGGTSGLGDGGPATSAALSRPYGVAVDTAGNLFIADQYNSRVREATFTPPCYTLSITDSPTAGGIVTVNTGTNCTGGYTSGTGISLTAVPSAI
jgi:hypothetical protein